MLFLVFMPLIGFLFRKCFLILFGIDRHGFLGVDLDRRLRSYCRETCFCRFEFHFVVSRFRLGNFDKVLKNYPIELS